MKRAALVTRAIDPTAIVAEVQTAGIGAISLFLGTVRDVNDGRAVSGIDYSAYVSMAEEEMQQILAEAEERYGVKAIAVEHRIGPLTLGDVSITINKTHTHRAPALDATRFVIDEIKKRVPIWKLEHYTDGAREWVDPTRSSSEAKA